MWSHSTPWDRYRNRIEDVIAFTHANLSEPLTADVLAEVAHLSPYHWHRIYRTITGESAAATVKRPRMHKAAGELVRTNQSIAEIGASVGLPEVHSFTRTFKTYYGTTPGAFRNSRPPLERSSVFPPDGDTSLHPVDIINKPNMRLAGLWHRGTPGYMAEQYWKRSATQRDIYKPVKNCHSKIRASAPSR